MKRFLGARKGGHLLAGLAATAAVLCTTSITMGQGFHNVPRTPGELLAGPIAPEQGRTAIIAWHDDHIVTVPEAPGSQPGADVLMRVVDIFGATDPDTPTAPTVTVLPAHTSGFHAHAYFHYGPYLYVGPHCLDASNNPCSGSGDIWADSLLMNGPGTAIGTSSMTRASMQSDGGLAIGGINRSGTQSPWGAEDFWSYNTVGGDTFLAVRRPATDWIYDWGNGGATTGPAIKSTWDHLGDTGVIGFPFIMGNILIYAADQTGSGVASYDISDLSNPVLLDVLKDENPGGYWPEVYGHYVFLPRRDEEAGVNAKAGFMVVDFSDPTDLRVVANRILEGSNQYVTFQDEFAFMNKYKIDMRDFSVALELPTVPGLLDASQFALPVGNLVVTGGYGTDGPGLAIWAHQAEPDTRAPYVLYHIPRPDQTNYSIHCPITLSIPETLRTETIVNGTSLIVRPLDGDPIDTWHSFGQGKLLTVTPQQVLLPDTTYEVILTSDIQDAAGNGLEPYYFRFSTGSGIGGGNQPPVIGSIASNPAPSAPGANVDFSWSGSDPDSAMIEYRIDFGDGTPRTDWGSATTAMHTYTERGHYQVTVQARDGEGAASARSRGITVASPPAAPGATKSSRLALDADTGRLYVANADNNSVTALETAGMTPQWESPVGVDPRSAALAADGALWVVCRDSDDIHILDPLTGATEETIQLPYGDGPVAIAPIPNSNDLLVSCESSGRVRRFSGTTRLEVGTALSGLRTPHAIAITADGTRALVTRFISGEHTAQVYDLNVNSGISLTRTINLARDRSLDSAASSRGVPNYLAGIGIDPSGGHAWVVGKKDNTTRGTFFGDFMVPGQDNTVRAQLMLIDLATNAEDTSLRLDIDNSDSPSAVEFSPLGDYAFIALQGNARVAAIDIFDMFLQESPGAISARFETGLAPQGIVFDAAQNRLYTADFMDRTLTDIDVADFLSMGSPNVSTTTVPLVEEERLHPDVLRGKQIFYHASDTRMSAEGYMSCATCHIDGGHDGRTWDFTSRGEGFRNTTDLRGRSGTGHGDVHWSANFDEIQDFENDIRDSFGGTGFLSDMDFAATSDPLGAPKAGLDGDLDALAAYVSFLGASSLPRSPFRTTDGMLSADAQAGQALFNAQGCATCHNPATEYTDRQMHDVGTLRASSGQRIGAALTGIDTPTLLGLHASAPYFHDGSAATLEDVLTAGGGRMEQAEDGILTNGAFAEDVNWLPLKEWHQSGFVELDGARTVSFNDVTTSAGGDGFLDIRYNSAYGVSNMGITVNGNLTGHVLAQTPNVPSWLPNEWRRVRIPVTYQAGTNTFSFRENGTGAQLYFDDVTFITPDHLAAAEAHVRPITAMERGQLAAYLLSLDGSNGLFGDLSVSRDGIVAPGSTDTVQADAGMMEMTVTYMLNNTGDGPLNIGRMNLRGNPGGEITVQTQPDSTVRAAESTTLVLHVQLTGVETTADIVAWTDDPAAPELTWTVRVVPTGLTDTGDVWLYY